MADDKPKVRFTEFEARCKRCRFMAEHTDKTLAAPMGFCAIGHKGLKGEEILGGRGTKVHTLYEIWTHYGRDWCPHYDEVPPPPPGLLRRIAKGLGLI